MIVRLTLSGIGAAAGLGVQRRVDPGLMTIVLRVSARRRCLDRLTEADRGSRGPRGTAASVTAVDVIVVAADAGAANASASTKPATDWRNLAQRPEDVSSAQPPRDSHSPVLPKCRPARMVRSPRCSGGRLVAHPGCSVKRADRGLSAVKVDRAGRIPMWCGTKRDRGKHSASRRDGSGRLGSGPPRPPVSRSTARPRRSLRFSEPRVTVRPQGRSPVGLPIPIRTRRASS